MVERPAGDDPRRTRDGSAAAGGAVDPTSEEALAERLGRLGEKLQAHPATVERTEPKGRSSGFGQATKIASEFVAGIVVGVAIGWTIDRAAGTSPWALIVFLLLGFAAGVLNVLRAEGKVADPGVRIREATRNSVSKSDGSGS